MATADCLLNCLHEVKLERFHRNFVERGLHNCEQLSSLVIDDYTRFGIVSTDDRRRLYQLIHIIKSVQADGVFCQHGGAVPPAPKKPANVISARNVIANGRSQPPLVSKSGPIPVLNSESSEVFVSEKCPPAPSKSFIKPIANPNYRVQYEPPAKGNGPNLHVVEETKVNVVSSIPERSNATPVFRCRKTLKFSDSELYSDDENGVAVSVAENNGNAGLHRNGNIGMHLESNNVEKVMSMPRSSDFALPVSNKVSKQQLSSASQHFISAPSSSIVTESRRDKKSDKFISHVQVDSVHPAVDGFQTTMHSSARAVHPVKRLSSGAVEEIKHAYFPVPEVGNFEEPPVHIEQVHHTAGYNYGVPSSNIPQHGIHQRTADVDLHIDGQIAGHTDKIRVCVRKRPRTVREVKRNDVDVVKVRGRRSVIVEELKVAVDLTKYMQQVSSHVVCLV